MSIKNLPLPLIIVMIMAPQILETLYSPALTAIRFELPDRCHAGQPHPVGLFFRLRFRRGVLGNDK